MMRDVRTAPGPFGHAVDVALQLAAVMLIAACGRTDPNGPLEPPDPPGLSQETSTLDAASDSNRGNVDATVADSHVGADEGAAADSYVGADQMVVDSYAATDDGMTADSALDSSPSLDAGADANTDASTSDAAEQHSTCDECPRGDQQCVPLPQVCTYNDAGAILTCGSPGPSIWTCVIGDAGCAVWTGGGACRPDVPCCVPCMHFFSCPLGSLGDVCEQDTDCAFDACDAISHVCTSDQCSDHRLDGQESDVDCGGVYCNACLSGRRCHGNFDCQSGHLCGPSHVCE
jgi:hypothetical protein